MEKLRVYGNQKANGSVQVSGAKNAALPLIAASLLSDGLHLTNVPPLSDINTMCDLLSTLGVVYERTEQNSYAHNITLHTNNVVNYTAPYDIVKKLRASILVLGPLLTKYGRCNVSFPGGCAIGVRPVDLHIRGLEKLGAEIELENGYIQAKAPKGLRGTQIEFPIVTVTGTENLLMAATLAKGDTILKNAAKEPEVVDLAECLNKMGAKISGHGTDTIHIQGVSTLHDAFHSVIVDRIEAGTYMILAGITRGRVKIIGENLKNLLANFIDKMVEAGLVFEESSDGINVIGGDLHPVDISTHPHPGYPTDLQAQAMSLLCYADGVSNIYENIWENRFMHVAELQRMGADISVSGSHAIIHGRKKLKGAPVMATDLRASFSLVLAGLAADGETIVDRLYHLDRGYCCVTEKLKECDIVTERVRE